MFKSKILLLTVICSITLVSCKKESLVTAPVTPSIADALIKTKTEGNIVETYTYDSQKRLSKVVFTSTTNGSSYYYEYTYTNDAVLEYHSNETLHELEETLPNGVTRLNCTANPRSLKLNNQGYYVGMSSTCEEKSLGYDANGFVVSQNYAITDFSKNETMRNDKRNVTTINSKGFSYLGGDFTTVVNLDYFYDKVNTVGNKNFGKNFLGKSSENLIKTESENNQTISYTYTFDAQQRVLNRTITKGGIQSTSTYTYY